MQFAKMMLAIGLCATISTVRGQDAHSSDSRDIQNGWQIPDEGYCDQPYVVVTDDGAWLCVLTTGKGVEGQHGQHVVATRSTDKGRTWSPLVDIEPADGPEASWVMPLAVPGGRVYAFYTYNADNLREVPAGNSPATNKRVDTLGKYVFKYSDDGGKTWSRERTEIPMRLMQIDRDNNVGGKFLFFWGVGKPIVHRGSAYYGFAKVGKWGVPGAMVTSQGVFMHSPNILTERDPARIKWELLPDGDHGLRAPKGPVSDEANLVGLIDGSLYATYRTIDGYPCHAYSRDGGHTWTEPAYMTYTPNGRRIKHPRAANFVRRFSNGKYLYWFHNHGGEPVHASAWNPYLGRNPAWVCGGVEKDGFMHWSEPEILLYDDDPNVRISYPDFVEDAGRFYVTETQKTIARVHEVDKDLLAGLWSHDEPARVVRDGLVLELAGADLKPNAKIAMPKLGDLHARAGFTLEFWIHFSELTAGQTILDTRDKAGKGIRLATSARSTLELTLSDGSTKATWDSDPGTGPGTLRVGAWQHVAVMVDGGPKLIMFVVDGVLNDGGAVREYGWGRFDAKLDEVNGAQKTALAPSLLGELKRLRLYNRALRTSESARNFRAGD